MQKSGAQKLSTLDFVTLSRAIQSELKTMVNCEGMAWK